MEELDDRGRATLTAALPFAQLATQGPELRLLLLA